MNWNVNTEQLMKLKILYDSKPEEKNCVGGWEMDMENTYESIVLGTAAKEGRVFTSEEKTLKEKNWQQTSDFQVFSSLKFVQQL